MHRRSVLFFAGVILLQSVLYGFGDPISKAAYETMSVYSLMTVRYAIAVAALLLVCGRRIAQGLRAVSVRLWLVPSLCIAAGYVLNNIALNLTTATSATFLRRLAGLKRHGAAADGRADADNGASGSEHGDGVCLRVYL